MIDECVELRRVVMMHGVAEFVNADVVNEFVGQHRQKERKGDVTLPCATTPSGVGFAYCKARVAESRAEARSLQHSWQFLLCHLAQLFNLLGGVGRGLCLAAGNPFECRHNPLVATLCPAQSHALGLPPRNGEPYAPLARDAERDAPCPTATHNLNTITPLLQASQTICSTSGARSRRA